eukprot:gene8395-8579_t
MNRALALSASVAAAIGAAAFIVLRKKRGNHPEVEAVVLQNKEGVEVHITPIGASIQRLILPVNGQLVDVVLGFNKSSTYANIQGTPYFGAIVGRCANRIKQGKFTINGQKYSLAVNNGPNALHGGPNGFHKQAWHVQGVQQTAMGQAVTLTYTSKDGEEGYPGNLQVTVRYELLAHEAELRTTIHATSDKPTSVNIAQHSYFNLAGHASGDVLNHQVKLSADHYTPVDEHQIPTGHIVPVAGTPFDFTLPHTIGERISQVENGYDHNYVLFGMGPQARFITRNQAASHTPRLAATVVEPGSGVTLQVLTTAPGVQFYVGGFLGEAFPDTKGGAHYPRFGGFCLETQFGQDAELM